MTGNEVFAAAAAYLAQTRPDSEEWKPFVPHWLNLLLQESLPYENAWRTIQGMELLKEAPILTQERMDEPLVYHEALVRTALPYGLARDFWRDDDNDYRANDFRARYIAALEDCLQAEAQTVKDCY